MSHEVLVLSNGELFTTRDMVYSEWARHQETYPCNLPKGGEGKMEITVDTAEVRFTASPGPLAEGDTGQISTGDERFHEVSILSVEEGADGWLLVSARARKRVAYKLPEDPGPES
jgi:hypothetical protein